MAKIRGQDGLKNRMVVGVDRAEMEFTSDEKGMGTDTPCRRISGG